MATNFEHIGVAAARLHSRLSCMRLAIGNAELAFAHVRVARTFADRLVGLLGQSSLRDGEGVLFMPGGSIHTLGMRFTIDVVFLDATLKVLKVAAGVRPWRFAWAPGGTRYVLELGEARAAAARLSPGVIVTVQNR
jgi:uncharacterized protein